jgi:hypothetical protein
MVGKDIELATVLDGTIGRVKADSVQMEEVISALVENACEAMPDGGQLTVETADVELARDSAQHLGVAESGRYAVLSVTDTGLGMDEETKSRIFEPFFSTKKEVKGTGLGLPTVYGIIKQSGGEIWVSSEPGNGTTVSIYLPVIVTDREALVTPVPALQSHAMEDRETILLVEDEPAVLSIRPDLRVIYMSGYTDNKTVREMMADKSTFFLQKPFTPSALAGITKRVLEDESGDTSAD